MRFAVFFILWQKANIFLPSFAHLSIDLGVIFGTEKSVFVQRTMRRYCI
jgi:hypothetical protein